MTAAVIAAIASTLAVIASVVGILINRHDKANEWRRDQIIPSVQKFLTAANQADQVVAIEELRVGMGANVEEARVSCNTAVTPLIGDASEANATLDLFAPELAELAAKIIDSLITTEANLGIAATDGNRVTRHGDAIRVQRPVFNECREMARQARVLSRIERRPLAEWITTRRRRC